MKNQLADRESYALQSARAGGFGPRAATAVAPRPFDRLTETRARPKVVSLPLKKLIVNRLLSALPGEAFARLLPHLEPVTLAPGQILGEAGEAVRFVHFPEDAVASHFCVMQDGDAVEVAMTGREGVVGLACLFGPPTPAHLTRASIGGSALRLRADVFKQEFNRGGALQRLLLGYAGERMGQVSQRAVCNSQHKVERRFASWLMMMSDRVGADELPLTQETIASHLGIRRAGISVAAKTLQEQGVINYRRGLIHILNREALELLACECYDLLGKV